MVRSLARKNFYDFVLTTCKCVISYDKEVYVEIRLLLLFTEYMRSRLWMRCNSISRKYQKTKHTDEINKEVKYFKFT